MWWPGMDKAIECCVKECSICQYSRKMPPAASPSELMWGRRLSSKLDMVLPDAELKSQEAQDRQKWSHDSHSADRHFGVNDTVYVRNYGVGQQWLSGRVVGLQGLAMYRVRLDSNHVIIRHVNQLRHRVVTTDSTGVDSSDLSDVGVPETGDSTETVEPESAETDQTSSDTSETPETQTTTSSTPAQESDSSEAAVEQTEDHLGTQMWFHHRNMAHQNSLKVQVPHHD
jgi:hypothetical protein